MERLNSAFMEMPEGTAPLERLEFSVKFSGIRWILGVVLGSVAP